LLSVFLTTDEYNDFIQRQSSTEVQQLSSSTELQPTQPMLDSTVANRVSKSRTKCSTVVTVADTVGVDTSDLGNVGEDYCKQTDCEDFSETLSGNNSGQLVQQQDRHAETQDATAVCASSADSGSMCQPCDDSASAQTSSSAATVVNLEKSTTVTESTSTNDKGFSCAALNVATDTHCASDENTELIPLQLYIQGNSQTVFLLFMQQGSFSELDVVRDLV